MRAVHVALLASLLVVGCNDLDSEWAPYCMDDMGCPPGTTCVDGMRCVMVPDAEVPRSPLRAAPSGGAPTAGPSRPPGGGQRDGGAGGCGGGRSECGGDCVDLRNDPLNCGRCGNACGAGVLCRLGVCCPSGFDLCTDRCVDLQNDSNNCGVCGFVCTNGLQCRLGTCQPPEMPTPPSSDPGDPGFPGETPPGSAF